MREKERKREREKERVRDPDLLSLFLCLSGGGGHSEVPVCGICVKSGHRSFGDGHRLGGFVGRTVYKHYFFIPD